MRVGQKVSAISVPASRLADAPCDLSIASPLNPASHLLTRGGGAQECRIIPTGRITVDAGSFMNE